MKQYFLPILLMMTLLATPTLAQKRDVKISIIETSDVHGRIFPYDFAQNTPAEGSLSRVATYVNQLRKHQGHSNVALLDNGDLLQGELTTYYFNYEDTKSPHLAARALNHLDYLCTNLGNHDIEIGRKAYDRFMNDCAMVNLGANVFDTEVGRLYLTAYMMEEIDGVRVGVIGLTTPTIPQWLPQHLWKGLDFRDMIATAHRVVPIIRRAGKADIVIALVHSGAGPANSQEKMMDNASIQLAEQVPGIDVVFCGHDHKIANQIVYNKGTGNPVILLNPGSNATHVAQADLHVTLNKGKVVSKNIEGMVVDVRPYEPDAHFLSEFEKDFLAVKQYAERVVGTNAHEIDSRISLFGSSAFVDVIHKLQLDLTGADISFSAPLLLDTRIPEGDIRISDLFNLYRYENQLAVIQMSGTEIKRYLEESYGQWTQQMKSPTDNMLLFHPDAENCKAPWERLQHSNYNFDSAAGIKYTVDLSKPKGQKIRITALANGRPFDLNRNYRVALNSYRACGGGNLLTKGAGIPQAQLKSRVIKTIDKDLRQLLIEEIQKTGKLKAEPLYNWRFIPEGWAANASERDAQLLFK